MKQNVFLLRIVFTLFLTLLLVQAKTLEKVSVQLEWKHQFEFAGFYTALEQGYYKDVGLDVKIKEFDSAVDIVQDVLEKKSTYGMSSSQLILERLSGKKIVQLASYLKQNALVIISRPEIKTVKDLKYKRVMATPNELQSTSLALMLQEHQLGLDDLIIIPHSFNIDAFAKGEIDALTGFISNQPFLLDQKNIPYNILNPAEDGIYSYDVELFTSEYEALKHPMRTKNFIDATHKGWEYALSHKEEITDLIYEKYTQKKSKEALLYEANILDSLMKRNLFKIGALVPELVELNTNMYVQLQMTNANWNLDGFMFNAQPRELDFTPNELKFIKAHPLIRFSDVVWEPFAVLQENSYSGIFQEYYKLLSQRTGLTFEFVKIGDGVNFQLVLDALKAKEIDMIDGSGKTENRKNYALFAGPLMQVSLAVASPQSRVYTTLDDLRGKKVVVAKGSTASEYLKEHFPNINLIYTTGVHEAFEVLNRDEADALIDNIIVLDSMIKNSPHLQNVEISAIKNYKFDLYALIRKDYALLRQIIDKAVQSITQEELLYINNKLLLSTIERVKKRRRYEGTATTDEQRLILTKEEKVFLKNKKQIIMCVDPDWMPYEKIEDGRHIGMGADYLKLIASKINTPITLIPTKRWIDSMALIKKHQCDILSMAMETPNRKKFMNFTKPYITVPLVIATSNDKLFISDIKELQGKTVGIGREYAPAELLKLKYPLINFIEIDTITEGLQQVLEGKLFGYIDNLTTVGYQIQKHFPTDLKITGQLSERLQLGIGVHQDEPLLLSILEKAIKSIDEREKQHIINQWVSVKYELGTDYTLSLQILFVTFFIVAITIFWNLQLKREIKKGINNIHQKEKLLLQQNRHAQMGEMISMIAHQWRQPLSAISSATGVLESKLALGIFNLDIKEDRNEYLALTTKKLKNITQYVQYLSTTIDDFRNFFKPDRAKEFVSLVVPIERALQIIKTSLKSEGIVIITEYHSDKKVLIYQNELMQVILNILKNSEDNFLEKNTLNPEIIIKTYTHKDKSAIISICDNGGGIPKSILSNIFDPYFSTKHKKNGTGLGLYMSKIITEEHNNGILQVKNSNNGVCFEIKLKEGQHV
ncbi:MAG: hypothetical protein DRG24_05215 [Epsilonproteobacteria bacterium]|nr:MAG: hypothetical protein DRG24_05215 [Campylobacterota bacterium]